VAVVSFNINGNPTDKLHFEPKMLINGGYTGRNQEEVQKHIDELKKIGVPAPDKTPVFFPKYPERLTQSEAIPCLDEEGHIGEAEYVLFVSGGEVYVSAGSDHTDRTLETVSIPKAKQMYPNTISKDAWKLTEIEAYWDELHLRSWVEEDGQKKLYQETPLGALLGPRELLAHVKKIIEVEDLEGLVLYSGTVAGKFEIEYSPYFEVELKDRRRGLSMNSSYRFRPVTEWFKG